MMRSPSWAWRDPVLLRVLARWSVVCCVAATAGCAPDPAGHAAASAQRCSAVDLLLAPRGEWLPDPEEGTRAAAPPEIRRTFASATTRDTADLDCDGVADWLGSVTDTVDLVPGAEGKQLQAEAAFVRRGAGWRKVLFAPVEDGIYFPILAADLAGSGRRDLVFLWEYDAGYTPVIFRWNHTRFVRVRVPREYTLSGYKAFWELDCMRLIRPAPAGGGLLRLMRETGAAEAAGCLPLDVVRVVGDSVALVRAGVVARD